MIPIWDRKYIERGELWKHYWWSWWTCYSSRMTEEMIYMYEKNGKAPPLTKEKEK